MKTFPPIYISSVSISRRAREAYPGAVSLHVEFSDSLCLRCAYGGCSELTERMGITECVAVYILSLWSVVCGLWFVVDGLWSMVCTLPRSSRRG